MIRRAFSGSICRGLGAKIKPNASTPSLTAREASCPYCHDGGQIDAGALPPESRRMAGDEPHVTADELARAFAAPGGEGRLAVLRRFPGLASRLDRAGQEALWDEVRRYPDLALMGHVPDALAEAGGVEHLARAAQQEPLAAGASLRALEVIGQRHSRGDEIVREILAGRATAPPAGAQGGDETSGSGRQPDVPPASVQGEDEAVFRRRF